LVFIVTATAPYILKEPVKHFVRAPVRGSQPKPAYASYSALRSKAPARLRGSQLNTRSSWTLDSRSRTPSS
jgi:hypothetical protein